MVNLFEDFKKWHPVFDASQSVLAVIDDKFEPREHRGAAALVLEELAKENGEAEDVEIEVAQLMQQGTKDQVKDHVSAGFTKYGRKLDEVINTKFDELWDTTPDGVKGEIYTKVTLFKPKSDSAVSDSFEEALKYHKFLADVGTKLDEYQTRGTTQSRRKEIENELQEILFEDYDKKYLDTPQKTKDNEELVKVMKKWAKKSPKMVLQRFVTKQEKFKEKFEEIVTTDNLKEYMTAVLDTENQRKLYGTAIAYYDHAEKERKAKEARDVLMTAG